LKSYRLQTISLIHPQPPHLCFVFKLYSFWLTCCRILLKDFAKGQNGYKTQGKRKKQKKQSGSAACSTYYW